MTQRTYDRTLRDAQAAATWTAILTAAQRVAAGGVATFTMAAVAREAGVALRTIYTHFPSRAGLLNAVLSPAPAILPGLEGTAPRTPPELLYRLQRSFATLASRLPVRQPATGGDAAIERQQATIATALAPALAALPPRDRQRLLNAVLLVSDARSVPVCRDTLGLDPAETAQLMVWCIESLLAAGR